MKPCYFKFKALSFTTDNSLDRTSLERVIDPIVNSYYYLPSREKLNDPNEGIFQNQFQESLAAFTRGVASLGERYELTKPVYELAQKINQSTDQSGVFSLTHNVVDELMWAHYGASHHGIAIEYNLSLLTRFSSNEHLNCFSVEYSEKPPSLNLQTLHGKAGEAVRKMLGYKSSRWSYEEEFRVVLENINGRIPHDYRAVKSITFGLMVPDNIRKVIFEKTKHKVIEFFEIVKVPETYLLDRKLLEFFQGETIIADSPVINWEDHFADLSETERVRSVEMAKDIISNDPHFNELLQAERSSNNSSKVILQYEVRHDLDLKLSTNYTKHYYDL